MHQQNKKNGNLILIKKRRILSRTEQSRQKLQANLITNNSLFKTPNTKSSKINKLQHQQNPYQNQNIKNQNLDQIIFWNTAKKKSIQAQFQNRQKTQSLIEFSSPKKHINPNDHQKLQIKWAPKIFGISKRKIFSHKTLRQGVGKIRSNTSESLLRINNEESVQNGFASKNLQIKDSEDGTEKKYYLKGIRQFTKRFKTEDTERDVNMQKIIQSIYSNRRRKLRLNSNEFSVELRMKRKPQIIKEDQVGDVKQQSSMITMKTANQKSLLKLPNQLANQRVSKRDKLERSLSANLDYSKDQNENKTFICQQQLPTTEIECSQPQNHQEARKDDDRRFIKKKPFNHVQNPTNPVLQSQTISIQDIQVVCFNDIQEIDLATQNIKDKSCDKKIDNLNLQIKTTFVQNQTKNKTNNKKTPQKTLNQTQSNDNQQIQFIQEIIFSQQNSPNLKKQKNEKTKQVTKQQTIQQLILNRSHVQSLNFIGEVGSECSQLFSKKNISWMVPTLLLYTYCLNFRNSTKNIFQQALKGQLLDENSFQQFMDQNQQLQQNINKIYQKTKKKNILLQQIQFFLLPNFDFSKKRSNLIQRSYIQIVAFSNLFLKNEEKKSLNYRQCCICAIKMIRAFLLILKIECQQKSRQGDFRLTQQKRKQMFTVPEINLNDLAGEQSDEILDKEFKVMKENFNIFCQLIAE